MTAIIQNLAKIGYISLCGGLKYLLKVRYIILVDPNEAGFLIFKTVFLGRSPTLSHVWKIYHKNKRHLRLIAHIITKLSQNIYAINVIQLIDILMYRHATCDCYLQMALWFYCIFFGYLHILLTIIRHIYSSIFAKFSRIVCLINSLASVHIFFVRFYVHSRVRKYIKCREIKMLKVKSYIKKIFYSIIQPCFMLLVIIMSLIFAEK